MKTRFGLGIRTAVPADADGLATLLAACGLPVSAPDLAARLERAAAARTGILLLAAEWGPPSGLLVAHWYATPTEPRPVGQVTLLVVDPERRRQGIARLLLKSASQAARSAGCDRIELFCPEGHPELDAFCRATGFAATGTRFDRPLRRASGD